MDNFYTLTQWLKLADAAKELSIPLKKEIQEYHLLRLALEGKLKLSFYLPTPIPAIPASVLPIQDEYERGTIPQKFNFPSPRNNFHLKIRHDQDVEHVQGIFDLPLLFGERLATEAECFEMENGKDFDLPVGNPIILERDGKYICLQEVPAQVIRNKEERAKISLPSNSPTSRFGNSPAPRKAMRMNHYGIFVIRTEELQRFEGSVNPTSPDTGTPPDKTERDKLLVTAALCNPSKIDHPGSGAANKIATKTLECPDCADDLLQPANHENTPLQHPGSMQPAPRDPKNNFARMATLARQKKTKDQREEVKAFYRDHIYPGNPNISNEQAGAWLKDTFTKISVRKLSEYAREAKNEIRSQPPADKT